jgi:hypothetical protein
MDKTDNRIFNQLFHTYRGYKLSRLMVTIDLFDVVEILHFNINIYSKGKNKPRNFLKPVHSGILTPDSERKCRLTLYDTSFDTGLHILCHFWMTEIIHMGVKFYTVGNPMNKRFIHDRNSVIGFYFECSFVPRDPDDPRVLQ